MSLKDLFNKKEVVNNVVEEFSEIYSSNEINTANSIIKHKILPNINFKNPANFVKFGFAEEYYKNSFNYILDSFPYDGSREQEIGWLNNATYLDKFIFNEVHTRFVGSLSFDERSEYSLIPSDHIEGLYYKSATPNYIKIYGGLNKSLAYSEFSDSRIKINYKDGFTFSFYYKSEERPLNDGGLPSIDRADKVIFNLVNSDNNIPLENRINFIVKEYYFIQSPLPSEYRLEYIFTIENSEVKRGYLPISLDDWNHYSYTIEYVDTQFIIKTFKNGLRVKTDYQNFSNDMNISDNYDCYITGTIGCLSINDGYVEEYGYGQLYGAKTDEFKIYSRLIDEVEMNSSYNSRDYSTLNNTNNNNKLSLYFKFNEGIIGDDINDSIVLDYSGRKSNCKIENYRNNKSLESGLVSMGFIEFQEPCLNPNNQSTIEDISKYILIGKVYDSQNSYTLFNTFPNWIQEEDELTSDHLFYLCQILASQLDEIYMQIKNMNKISSLQYNNTGTESEEILSIMINSYGLDIKDILSSVSFDEWNMIKNDEFTYGATIQKIKSVLYRNLYNNLIDINKSKGTKESLRMLFRTLGVQDNLYSINLYTDNDINKVEDSFEVENIEKKYINFNKHVFATFTPDVTHYITGSNISTVTPTSNDDYGISYTFETNFKFPYTFSEYDKQYSYYPQSFLTSSVFGFNSLLDAGNSLETGSLSVNFGVSRENRYSEYGRLLLYSSSSLGESSISSDLMKLYNGSRWQFTATLSPSVPLLISAIDYEVTAPYKCTLTAINVDEMFDDVILSTDISIKSFCENKTFYVGAKRENTSGNILTASIGKIYNFRGWMGEHEYSDIHSRSKNISNFGTNTPSRNMSFGTFFSGSYVPNFDSLIFNWDFENVTTSDDSGLVMVEDFSKPYSYTNTRTYPKYFTENLCKINQGHGIGFPALENTVFGVESLSIQKNNTIDNISINNISIIDSDDLFYKRITKPVDKILTVEKNIADSINREILKYFSNMQQLSNCFGFPYEKYRESYKGLDNIKLLFFEKMNNDLIEYTRFLDFYKWIDFSMFYLIQQIIPLSLDSGLYGNFIENHVLKRNKLKYHKLFQKINKKELNNEFTLSLPNFSELNWDQTKTGQSLINFDWNPLNIPNKIGL